MHAGRLLDRGAGYRRVSTVGRRESVPVLFTSAGRRVELLRAFRRGAEALGLESRTVAVDVDPLAPALQAADRSYLVPPLGSPDYIPEIAAICRSESIRMVFPLIDPDIPVLAANRDVLESTGARLAVVGEEAAALAGDKWAANRFFRDLGLAAPRSWLPEDISPETARYPLFIRPRRGSAGRWAFRVDDAAALRFLLRYVPEPFVQEFVSGPEVTSDVVCDLDGRVLGIVSRRRIEVRSGEASKAVTVRDEQVLEGCARIAAALPAVGPITVQCLMRDGVAWFTEVNARLGGGAPLAIAAGADFPRWLLAVAAGLPAEIPPVGAYRTGVYLTRFDDSYFIDEMAREQLASRRIRPG